MFKVTRRALIFTLLILFNTLFMSIAFADIYGGDDHSGKATRTDGGAMKPRQDLKVMQLEPTTDQDAAKVPATMDPSRGGNLSCPAGFALTSVAASPEMLKRFDVCSQCNGAGAYYVHVWCRNDCAHLANVEKSPTVSYTCQKIKNQWVKKA